jgi:hypothetical protein
LICNHFKPALDDWQQTKNVKFPTPEQVMGKVLLLFIYIKEERLTFLSAVAIINENYATLELKPMDKIHLYVAFNEIPAEMGFFRQILRVAVIDYLEYYTLSISPS